MAEHGFSAAISMRMRKRDHVTIHGRLMSSTKYY